MSGDLSGFSMFELFRDEARVHAITLSEGLLAVEENPSDLKQFESLMRAAHSIKGAARIIGLDVIVDMAHGMEDRLVALQKGEETITPTRTDQLLQGVDLIRELADLEESQIEAWSQSHQQTCQSLAKQLNLACDAPADKEPLESNVTSEATAVVDAETGETTKDTTSSADLAENKTTEQATVGEPDDDSAKESLAKAPEFNKQAEANDADREPVVTQEAAGKIAADGSAKSINTADSSVAVVDDAASRSERTVPVNSENLNRIMRLAGESMIESRRLQSLGESLSKLRTMQQRLGEIADQASRTALIEPLAKDLQTMRELGGEVQQLLQDHSTDLEQALWRSERTSSALYNEVIGSRMRPFSEGTIVFPRMIRDLARKLDKKVRFKVIGDHVAVDRDILRKLEAPLNHILRNCVDHGIDTPQERIDAGKSDTGTITLHARHHAGMLSVDVQDDGRGIDPEALRNRIVERGLSPADVAQQLTESELWEFLFLPGFTTTKEITEVSGRGVGLDVVRNMVQEVSGTVHVESTLGLGTTFQLRLPVTLSVVRAVLADIGGEPYAFPLSKLTRVLRVAESDLQAVQGKQQLQLNGKSVGLVRATEILELPNQSQSDEELSIVVFGPEKSLCGLVVDQFCGEQDLVVRPLDPQLGKVQHISSAAVTDAGEAVLFVDVEDLALSIQQRLGDGRISGMTRRPAHLRRTLPRILVVDDSITVREVERQLLTHHGYDVEVAVDGQDGLNRLRASHYDLLITDVDMPRMNGIELIEAVRGDNREGNIPIIIVSYKDRESDRLAGMEAGANAYLTKGSFHDDSFISTVKDLIGAGT
ncbi:MAG: hybrid sensor histidine kinase/response regulator [Pirellulaceae bacterium]|nr:hybrid sensor histidine kinase/response regulator [Pirellulaceae bacterium]